jgi:hypothetical protein
VARIGMTGRFCDISNEMRICRWHRNPPERLTSVPTLAERTGGYSGATTPTRLRDSYRPNENLRHAFSPLDDRFVDEIAGILGRARKRHARCSTRAVARVARGSPEARQLPQGTQSSAKT